MTLKIFLKGKKTPFVAVLSSEAQFFDLLDRMKTEPIVKIGLLVFNVSELHHIEIEE